MAKHGIRMAKHDLKMKKRDFKMNKLHKKMGKLGIRMEKPGVFSEKCLLKNSGSAIFCPFVRWLVRMVAGFHGLFARTARRLKRGNG